MYPYENSADGRKRKVRCSFCGKGQDEVAKLIAGPNVYICTDCIQLCNMIIRDEGGAPAASPACASVMNEVLPKPAEIKHFLDEHVVGQDQAKKVLSVAVYNHYCDKLLKNQIVEVLGLGYIRGENLDNCIFILEHIKDKSALKIVNIL